MGLYYVVSYFYVVFVDWMYGWKILFKISFGFCAEFREFFLELLFSWLRAKNN